MGNILINKNYGDIYNVQSGATVVARGAEAAMMLSRYWRSRMLSRLRMLTLTGRRFLMR